MDDSNQSRPVTATEQFMTQHPKGYRWSAFPGIDRALHFHEVMGLPVSTTINLSPTVTERVLRCQLMLEEVLEFFDGMGVKLADLETTDVTALTEAGFKFPEPFTV